jgi:sulfur carrier protein
MTATITLNGSPHPLPAETNVASLLESLGLAGKPVVVELDGEAVFPRDHPQTRISDGARVEIVTLAAGG